MKKLITKTIFIFLIIMGTGIKAQTGAYIPELARFDTAMLDLLMDHGVAGAQLAITYKGRMVYNRGFGYTDTISHKLVQPDNIFRIASLSKPVTSIAIMKLVEQGLLHLNDTVFGSNGILNDSIYLDIKDSLVYNITIRNLLNHTGGWDSNISGDIMYNSVGIASSMGTDPPASPQTVVRYIISKKTLDFEPGTQYRYSNNGFCILGRVIEKVTGQRYEDYVQNNILSALNISNMHPGRSLEDQLSPLETHHYDYPGASYVRSVYNNNELVPWQYGGFSLEAMDSYGGWLASAGDLCTLLLGIDKLATQPDILLPGTIDTMTTRSIANYALGWSLNKNERRWHRGSMPGTTSAFMLGLELDNINCALVVNLRPYDSGALNSTIDNLVLNLIPSHKSWPKDVTTAIINSNNEPVVSISSNPCNGAFTINSNEIITNVEIFNELGQRVYLSNNSIQHSPVSIDITHCPKGIYFVKIKHTLKSHTEKLIVR